VNGKTLLESHMLAQRDSLVALLATVVS
jgi:hypothetical protein